MDIKALIIADSHGDSPAVEAMIGREFPFHVLVHCGDGVGDLFHVNVPKGVAVVPVLGNVDLSRGYDLERVELITIAGREILVTHGDLFDVKNGYGDIRAEGARLGVHAVLFGHTHMKYLGAGSPLLFNPGPANRGSYGVLMAGESLVFTHKHLR